jgi:hypothetical protein
MRHSLLIILILTMICFTGYRLPVNYDTVKGKIFFSDQPFTTGNTGSKKTFTSADYIYGRIELDAETINKAFRVFEPNVNYPHAYFLYRVYIFHNGQEMGFNSSRNLCLLREKDKNNKWFNFDVLPEPSKASTVISGTQRFEYYSIGTVPLYGLIDPDNFKENGEYKIVVKFYTESYDAWGNMEPVEKWPVLEEEFAFIFNAKDVPMLKKNEAAAGDVIGKNAFGKGK